MATSNSSIEYKILYNIERIPWSGCWIWTGAAHPRYGQIRIAGKVRYAHRVSYEIFIGEIPEGMSVCHSCDVGFCVNPSHIFLGTHAENMADMSRKKRVVNRPKYGEKHHGAILSNDDVMEIIFLRNSGITHREIAVLKKVSQGSVSGICGGYTWSHLTGIVKRPPSPLR